jgi:3-phenylpropionate/trans-cinnamate dioxygenase ferredoxin subunit
VTETTGGEVRVGRLDELPAGRATLVEVGGTRMALARVGEAVYACGDVCSHSGGPLSEGRLSGFRLACPYHGWMYDVRSGICVLPARGTPVPTYRVRVANGEVWVTTP